MPSCILLYAVRQPFVAEKAAKGCPSMTRILRGSLFRHLLSASAAYVFLIAQVSKEIRFRIVHITKCPAMAPGTGIGYRGIPAAPGTGQQHPDRQRFQHWHDGERLPIPGGVAPIHLFQRSLAFEKIIQGAKFKYGFEGLPNDCPGATHRKQVGRVGSVNAIVTVERDGDLAAT